MATYVYVCQLVYQFSVGAFSHDHPLQGTDMIKQTSVVQQLPALPTPKKLILTLKQAERRYAHLIISQDFWNKITHTEKKYMVGYVKKN